MEVGWWGIPLLITVLAFGWAIYEVKTDTSSSGPIDFSGLTIIGAFGAAIIIVLVVWLIYFIIY